jgi:hypothetical protein
LSRLGFYVLAPQSEVDQAVFAEQMSRESIQQKVELRVREYIKAGDEKKQGWLNDWFQPTFKKVDIRTISWEDVITVIEEYDLPSVNSIGAFYSKCIDKNKHECL